MADKIKKRSARRDEEVDALRTIWWFRCLSNHLETHAPREVQRAIAPQTLAVDINGEQIKNNKFLGYSLGEHVPNAALVRQAEEVVPRSGWLLRHVIWQVLRSPGSIKQHALKWIRQLDLDVQQIVLGPYGSPVGGASRHTLGSLERRASLDSLAALTILMLLRHEEGESEWAWLHAYSVFRVLLLMGMHLEQHGVAERLFKLYSQRIFSLAVFDGKRMDPSCYDYVFAANHLAGVANKIKEKHATQRDRRIWTFYALQALTGVYQQRFRKYFEIPLVAVL